MRSRYHETADVSKESSERNTVSSVSPHTSQLDENQLQRPPLRVNTHNTNALGLQQPAIDPLVTTVDVVRHGPESDSTRTIARLRAEGKFLFRGQEKYYVKGTTYGTFEPDSSGVPFPDEDQVAQDFKSMAENSVNTVRVYTVPPRWLLDLAYANNLQVLVGIPWEQHLAFLDNKDVTNRIESACRNAASACRGHAAVMGYSLGNEIKENVVSWHGRKKVEKFLKRLYHIVKTIDPESLVTYVNFPTTGFLNLDFLDVISFNVYLESKDKLEAYIAQLHSIAGEKPLLLAEVGLDSQRNGDFLQAQTLKWQIKSVFDAGCSGLFVYAWTDEWFTEGHFIEDWDFGLTTRERVAKPALPVVRKSLREATFNNREAWPRISVVVCSYNGAATIEETISAIQRLDYPDYELVIINDGSTDNTGQLARNSGAVVVTTENRGLSNARNTGWQVCTGDIVAYCDDDAYPDEHWLRYLAISFRDSTVGAAGGPNLPPPNDGFIADCVFRSPGGPMEVLISDVRAEHVPGCNMCIRRNLLEKLGGFDAQFRSAGDDVDMCWRILDAGYEIAFHAAAVNWHHRRDSVAGYLTQQQGYGCAEALLAKKWPAKYNSIGHIAWQGVVYGKGVTRSFGIMRERVYSGIWGSAPFQRLYKDTNRGFAGVLLVPEILLLLALLLPFAIASSNVDSLKPIMLVVLALSGLLLTQSLANGIRHTRQAAHRHKRGILERFKQVSLVSFLHLVQPVYRLKGRLLSWHTPLFRLKHLQAEKMRGFQYLFSGLAGSLWEGQNKAPVERLSYLYSALCSAGFHPENEHAYSPWDLQLGVLPFCAARLKLMVEEYGEQVELVRYRFRPGLTPAATRLFCGLICVLAGSLILSQWLLAILSSALLSGLLALSAFGFVLAMGEIDFVLKQEQINSEVDANPESLSYKA